MPALDPENFQALKDGIKNAGEILHSLVVWLETGNLLDGHHRDRARNELIAEGCNIASPSIRLMSFPTRAEAAVWVLQHAKGTRQNFGTFQKIHQSAGNETLMTELATVAEQRMKGGRGRATVAPGSEDETAKVTAQIAKIVGCSETTAKEALAVSRQGQFVEMIQAGTITAHSAYRAIRRHAQRNQTHKQIEQNLPEAHKAVELATKTGTLIGKVHHCDVLVGLKQLADASVSLVVTSPPYPLTAVRYPNWTYDRDYAGYLRWMKDVFSECKRVLATGGKLIINFDNCNIPSNERQGAEVRHDCRRDFANTAGELGLIYVDEYFWAKQNAVGTRPVIGTKGKPSGHRVNNNAEYVCVWAKDQVQKEPEVADVAEEKLIDLTTEEQFKLSMQVWMIKPANRNTTKHRCAFPVELARRLILLYSYLQDTVLDPFSGSGTTCATAASMGRKFVGFDNALQHVEIANRRIQEALSDPLPPPKVPDWEIKREHKRAKNNEKFLAKHHISRLTLQ